MKKVIHFLDEHLEEVILVFFLAVICVLIFLQVIMRYVFKNALAWPEELSRYCFVYSGMLSAGYCMKHGMNFKVDLFYSFFPQIVKHIIEYASMITIIILYGYVFWKSFGLLATTDSVSTALQIPLQYVYVSLTIGMGLGVIRTVQQLVIYTKNLKGKESEK